MQGRSWTANWTGRKASMHEKTFKLLRQMDSKWSTADVGPLKGQAKKVQGADEDTEP